MRIYKGKPFREFRCSNCRKLIACEYIFAGRLLIKCHSCGTLNSIEIKSTKAVLLRESVKPTEFIKDSSER